MNTLDIIIKWTTIDRQGPGYEPFTSFERIFFVQAITELYINQLIKKEHPGWLIQEIKIADSEEGNNG